MLSCKPGLACFLAIVGSLPWPLARAAGVPTAAQSLLTLAPQDCDFHQGDDPSWAAPSLDDSGWSPYSEWRADISHPRLWIRCHTNLGAIRHAAQPAIQVRLYGAYELYLDGNRIGAAGNLATGNFRLDVIRSYPIASAQIADSPQVIALRIFDRSTIYYIGPLRGIVNRPFQLAAGDASLLDALRAQEFVARAQGYSTTVLYYAIVGILSIPLLALYLFDRTRRPALLLCLASLGLCCSRSNEFAEAAFAPFSISTACIVTILSPFFVLFAQYPFFFALAGRRMPRLFIILLALPNLHDLQLLFDAFGPAGAPAWFLRFNNVVINPVVFGSVITLSLTPFVVFWPYSAIPRRMRPLAIFCLAWGAIDIAWYLVAATATSIPNLYARWGLNLLSSRGAATACVVAGLLGFLFREQRHIALDRATLAGELQAAQQIQRMLVQPAVDSIPGVHIEVAFHPMREVGGDLYTSRVLPGNRQRIVLGDVSGKGAAAAMTGAVLLGAAQEHDSDSPAALLEHLNRVLTNMRLGGFATCLCAELSATGKLMVANAGHLAPYRNGEEMTITSALPLGILADSRLSEDAFQLQPGDRLTLFSDGVVEARNASGELFGFDRAAALCSQPADAIAQAAQAFGQEDDITVLTLSLVPVEVARA